jgi:hypothetical protein
MVGDHGSLTPSRRGSAIDVFYIDDARSRISSTVSQGPAVEVFLVDGGHSWISTTASQGAAVDVFCIDGGRSRISGTASQGAHHMRFFLPCDILQLSG